MRSLEWSSSLFPISFSPIWSTTVGRRPIHTQIDEGSQLLELEHAPCMCNSANCWSVLARGRARAASSPASSWTVASLGSSWAAHSHGGSHKARGRRPPCRRLCPSLSQRPFFSPSEAHEQERRPWRRCALWEEWVSVYDRWGQGGQVQTHLFTRPKWTQTELVSAGRPKQIKSDHFGHRNGSAHWWLASRGSGGRRRVASGNRQRAAAGIRTNLLRGTDGWGVSSPSLAPSLVAALLSDSLPPSVDLTPPWNFRCFVPPCWSQRATWSLQPLGKEHLHGNSSSMPASSEEERRAKRELLQRQTMARPWATCELICRIALLWALTFVRHHLLFPGLYF
jgi:hypothetical protein